MAKKKELFSIIQRYKTKSNHNPATFEDSVLMLFSIIQRYKTKSNHNLPLVYVSFVRVVFNHSKIQDEIKSQQ